MKYSIDLQDTIKLVKKKHVKYLEILDILSRKAVVNNEVITEINQHKSTKTYLMKIGYKAINNMEIGNNDQAMNNDEVYGKIDCILEEPENSNYFDKSYKIEKVDNSQGKLTNDDIAEIEKNPLKFFRKGMNIKQQDDEKINSFKTGTKFIKGQISKNSTKSIGVRNSLRGSCDDGVSIFPRASTLKFGAKRSSKKETSNGSIENDKENVKRASNFISPCKLKRNSNLLWDKDRNNTFKINKSPISNKHLFPNFYEGSRIAKDSLSEHTLREEESGFSENKYHNNITEIVKYFDDYIGMIYTLNSTFSGLCQSIGEIKDDNKHFFNRMMHLDERLANLEERQHQIEENLQLD